MTSLRPTFELGKMYHLFNRHYKKWRICRCDEDYERFRKVILSSAKKYEIELVVYAVMDTHFHVLVKGKIGDSISKYLFSVQSSYAQYYNRKYGYKGHVFEGSYKWEVADNYSYVTTLKNYILRNPLDRILEIYVKEGGISGKGIW